MRTRADYHRAVDLVRSVIAEWDPYSLLAEGFPHDEFDQEAAKLATLISQMTSPELAAIKISAVFSEAFDPKDFPPSVCTNVGAKLYARLSEAGLIASSA